MNLRVILTGGGTGGHLYPGLAIIEELQKHRDCEVQFIGTKHGVENRVIPEMNIALKTVWIAGIHRGRIIANLMFPLKMIVSLLQSILILMLWHPDLVIGTGGYVSWPVMYAAWILRKKRFIQEQNQQPGLVTKKLAPLMHGVFVSFEDSCKFFKKQKNLYVCGNPTRGILAQVDVATAYQKYHLNPQKTTLLVFGGSQGAWGINQAMVKRIDRLMSYSYLQILWGTGLRWYDEIKQKFLHYQERICVLPYIKEMDAAYSVSDLIICRAGATTVAEITRLGKAAIFIPFPGAAANHQEANARTLTESNAAMMVLESEIMSGKLDLYLEELIHDSKKRETLAEECRKFGHPEAAACIVDQVLKKIEI